MDVMDMNVLNKVMEHYDKANELGFKVVGAFLQGSQNYKLDIEGSDVDTKVIVLPRFKDIVLNKKSVSTTHVMDDGSHMDVKDIRLMFNEFKKQNINFVELLFTDYKVINSEYTNLLSPIFIYREEIARYKPIAALKCAEGQAKCRLKEIQKEFDKKKFSTILRMESFMINYIGGCDYNECIIPDSFEREHIKGIKSGEIDINKSEAMIEAKYAVEHCKLMLDMYENNNKPEVNANVDILLENVITNIFSTWFKEELRNFR